MKIQKRYIRKFNHILNTLGVYSVAQYIVSILDIKDKLIDLQLTGKSNSYSDLLKYSTGQFFIKHFYGYMGHSVDMEKGFIGFGLLHYTFIRMIRPERVLCVGSKEGFIPAICALACKDNQKGKVDFVDANKSEGEENDWGGTGFWTKDNIKNHFKPYDLNNFIEVHAMTTKKYLQKYPKRKYSYVYIDGDHTYEGCKHDYKAFWPRLASGGMMSFHDITMKGLDNGQEYGVWKLWDELKNMHPHTFFFSKGGNDNSVGFIHKEP